MPLKQTILVALLLAPVVAVGQTVSVGSASAVQSGTTTTITVPVTVTGSTSTTTATATALPFLSVECPLNSSVQVLGASFTTLVLPSVVVDTASGWNASSNSYTVPNTGTYLILSRVRLVDNVPGGLSYGQGVNTSNVDGSFFQWTTTVGPRNGSVNMRILKLTAGQTVNLYMYVDGTSTLMGASLLIQELS